MGTVSNQNKQCQFSPRMWREGSCLLRIILLTCANVLCKLISVLKDEVEYCNAAWLLKYQMESLLDVYKRLM